MSSRYFCRLEKKRGTEQWIAAIHGTDGKVATDIDGICRSWVDFFPTLFSADVLDLKVQEDLLENLSVRLPSSSSASCDGALLSLDQEKAFDRVDHGFLFRIMSHVGFGSSFISWVKLLYSGISSAVCVNGYTSAAFFPSRGVRQGCPLSPLLYVLSIEVLAANLRASKAIPGLRLPHVSTPLPVVSLYADDTTVIALSDTAILEVFRVYARFEAGTGSKLNLGKCEGLWLGPWRFRTNPPVDIQWSSSKLKILGVFISYDEMGEINWRPHVDAFCRCIDAWRSRALSFSGRAVVLNSLALSRIWYVASVVAMPKSVLKELNTRIFNFFWAGKKARVARKVLHHSKSQGGFSVVSVELKIHCLLGQWFRRFGVSPGVWVSLLTFWCFDLFGVSPMSVLSQPSTYDIATLPTFLYHCFLAWIALGGSLSVMTYFFHGILLFPIVLGSSFPFLGLGIGLQRGVRCFLCPSTDK